MHSKPVLSGHSKRRPKLSLTWVRCGTWLYRFLIFATLLTLKTDYRLMKVKSIAECSNGSILQYFRPSLNYHLSLSSLFCLFLSGHLKTCATVLCFYRRGGKSHSQSPSGDQHCQRTELTTNMELISSQRPTIIQLICFILIWNSTWMMTFQKRRTAWWTTTTRVKTMAILIPSTRQMQ